MRQCERSNPPMAGGDAEAALVNSLSATRLLRWNFAAILALSLVASPGCSRLRHRWFGRETTVPTIEIGQAPRPIGGPIARTPRLSPFRTGPLARVAADHWEQVGVSVEGRAIEARLIGFGSLRILLIGGIHGDEPEGLPLVDRLADELAENPASLRGSMLLVVRNLNPDGTVSRSRTNQNGVDLNRNFPASNWEPTATKPQYHPGDRPESEPETQVLVRLMREFRPQRILVMHATRGQPMVNYDGPARELAESMTRYNGYVTSDTIGYPTPGSLGSYAGVDLQIPIITLELPRGIRSEPAWEANRDALYEFLR